jgi:small subunit ribosomal protein S18
MRELATRPGTHNGRFPKETQMSDAAPAVLDPKAAAAIPAEKPQKRQPVLHLSASGKPYIDYKETETLRRNTAHNGKISGRRRTGASALEQRMLAEAIKRARYMALLPYVNAAP